MGLDHSNAFVRLSFDGLIGFCICKRDYPYRCEMGMVQAEDHEPLLRIIRINPNGTTEPYDKVRKLTPDDHVRIEATLPDEPGVRTFPSSSSFASFDFDRLSDRGDPEDFRWVMDLQGSDFHGPELRLKRNVGAEYLLRPRITVPHAIFYTLDKTQYILRRLRHPDKTPGPPIGKIADKVGADILCKPDPKPEKNGEKLVKVFINKEEIKLERNVGDDRGLRYWIEITNLCRPPVKGKPTCGKESDFPKYYTVAEDTDGIEYDLDAMYDPKDHMGKTDLPEFAPETTNFPEFAGFRSNGAPQVCAVAFFGLSNSIP